MRKISQFDVGYNHLGGTLPSELGQWTNVDYIGIYYNTISGTIPTQLGLMRNITRL
jgi:hypothetical protein